VGFVAGLADAVVRALADVGHAQTHVEVAAHTPDLPDVEALAYARRRIITPLEGPEEHGGQVGRNPRLQRHACSF
jgi:hypothetical protein